MMAKLNLVNVDLRNLVLSVYTDAQTPSHRHYCHGVSGRDHFSRLLNVMMFERCVVISTKLNCEKERER